MVARLGMRRMARSDRPDLVRRGAVMRSFFRLSPESPDLLHLDMLRLIAAYAIVLVHFRVNLLAFTGGSPVVYERLYGFAVGVDLFFVISGFVISWVYRDRLDSGWRYAAFLRKRGARLLPLHWATLLFFVLVGLFSQWSGIESSRPAKYAWDCLAQNALLLHAFGTCGRSSFNTVSWSISAEAAMYVLYPLLYLAVTRSPRAFGASCLCLVVFLQTAPLEPFWVSRTHDLGVLRALPGFCLGVLLFRYRDRVGRIPCAPALLAGVIALFATGVILGWHSGVLVLVAYAIATLGVAADMRGRVSPLVRALAPGGRLTYSVYMLHPIVQSLFIVLLGRRILGLEGAALSLWTLAAFSVVGFVGLISLKLFEEPMRRWMARTGGRGEAAVARDEKFSI